MRTIRKLIYRLGFRPKYPSIFFSPSQHVIRIGGPAVREGFIKGLTKQED